MTSSYGNFWPRVWLIRPTKERPQPFDRLGVWVDETARTNGLGSALLVQVETKTKAPGAHSAKLDTFEWQAPRFYAKRGYQEFSRIENHTSGCLALRKEPVCAVSR